MLTLTQAENASSLRWASWSGNDHDSLHDPLLHHLNFQASWNQPSYDGIHEARVPYIPVVIDDRGAPAPPLTEPN